MTPVFDGHNDALLRLWEAGGDPVALFAKDTGQVCLPAMAAGGMRGGFFAMFPVEAGLEDSVDFSALSKPAYDLPLPQPMAQATALTNVLEQAAIARALCDAGQMRMVRSMADLDMALEGDGPPALLLHLEGAEAIGPDLTELDQLYDLGLRSIGPVWSRPTIFASGVAFRYPSTGDTGPGLTEAGRRLVNRARDKGMVVDLSHMTERGFWDVAKEGLPLVATHSNAHAVTPSSRNLTDAQLRAIGETGGVAGLNFGSIFLRTDGRMDAGPALDAAVAHLDHMIGVAGEDHVALGSDFDGAPMTEGLTRASDLPNLIEAMRARGYSDELVAKLCHGNWRRLLSDVLP